MDRWVPDDRLRRRATLGALTERRPLLGERCPVEEEAPEVARRERCPGARRGHRRVDERAGAPAEHHAHGVRPAGVIHSIAANPEPVSRPVQAPNEPSTSHERSAPSAVESGPITQPSSGARPPDGSGSSTRGTCPGAPGWSVPSGAVALVPWPRGAEGAAAQHRDDGQQREGRDDQAARCAMAGAGRWCMNRVGASSAERDVADSTTVPNDSPRAHGRGSCHLPRTRSRLRTRRRAAARGRGGVRCGGRRAAGSPRGRLVELVDREEVVLAAEVLRVLPQARQQGIHPFAQRHRRRWTGSMSATSTPSRAARNRFSSCTSGAARDASSAQASSCSIFASDCTIATRARVASRVTCASMIRTSIVPTRGCTRTSHQRKLGSGNASQETSMSTVLTHSSKFSNRRGTPTRGTPGTAGCGSRPGRCRGPARTESSPRARAASAGARACGCRRRSPRPGR